MYVPYMCRYSMYIYMKVEAEEDVRCSPYSFLPCSLEISSLIEPGSAFD